MIKTDDDFLSATEFIDKEPGFYSYELSRKMDSFEHNLYYEDAEYYLDMLYEKLRVIEDLIEYTENRSNASIETLKKLVSEKEYLFEKKIAGLFAPEILFEEVSLDAGHESFLYDRNGAKLSCAFSDGMNVTPAYIDKDIRKIRSIDKETEPATDSDNLEEYFTEGVYLAYYNLEAPEKITEYLHFDIDNASGIDFAEFEPLNCTAEYLGTDDSGKAVIKLEASNMSKEQEGFSYPAYCGSALDRVAENAGMSSPGELVYARRKESGKLLDDINRKNYLTAARRFIAYALYPTVLTVGYKAPLLKITINN